MKPDVNLIGGALAGAALALIALHALGALFP
jgi:hypothetical protein